jgi:hypothetical protein
MSVPRKNPYLTTRDLIVLGKIPIVLGKITNWWGKIRKAASVSHAQ